MTEWRCPKTTAKGIVNSCVLVLVCLQGSCTSYRLPEADNNAALQPLQVTEQPPPQITDDLIFKAAGIDAHVQRLVRAIMENGNAKLIAGNDAEMLIDGPETFSAIIDAIEKAEHHIHLETYIFADDKLGRTVQRLLIERAGKGIQVRVIYDGFGSFATGNDFFTRMSEAGVEVLPYKPLDIGNILPWQINNRDHRKLLVIDGKVAFTGGINITDAYTSSSSLDPGREDGMEEGWRDTHVMIHGPATNTFQRFFLQTWGRLGGNIPANTEAFFPENPRSGHQLVAAVASRGDEREANIYGTYLAAINHARKNIYLMNAYFIPNKALTRALQKAAERGVDVALMVPGFTDSSLSIAASQASFEQLLESGVRIFEHHSALLHAKTGTVDGIVSIVGSANLDMRSFLHNNEINAVIVSSKFATQSESAFQQDLKKCEEITLDSWRQRPFMDKVKESLARLFSYWL